MPSRCTGYNVKRFNPSVHGRYFQSTFGRSPQAFVSPAPCLPRTPSQSMLMKMPSRPKGKSIRMRPPPPTLIERGRGGAGETNAATQMQSKYPPCAVTQNFLSLLLSGLGIEVRNPIREVSVIFVSPLFPRIYGLQILIETRPWLSKCRKRLFEVVSPFCHICWCGYRCTTAEATTGSGSHARAV